MPTTQDVAVVLAARVTDEQMGQCRAALDGSGNCGAHSGASVRWSLKRSGSCRAWLDQRERNEATVRHLIEDEAAKDILMEFWDV